MLRCWERISWQLWVRNRCSGRVYAEDCVSQGQVYWWAARFWAGRTSLKGSSRSGQNNPRAGCTSSGDVRPPRKGEAHSYTRPCDAQSSAYTLSIRWLISVSETPSVIKNLIHGRWHSLDAHAPGTPHCQCYCASRVINLFFLNISTYTTSHVTFAEILPYYTFKKTLSLSSEWP